MLPRGGGDDIVAVVIDIEPPAASAADSAVSAGTEAAVVEGEAPYRESRRSTAGVREDTRRCRISSSCSSMSSRVSSCITSLMLL